MYDSYCRSITTQLDFVLDFVSGDLIFELRQSEHPLDSNLVTNLSSKGASYFHH